MSTVVAATLVVMLTVVVVKVVGWLMWYRTYFLFFNSLPGETDFSWLWGNLHKFLPLRSEERLMYFEELCAKYPKFFRLWFGPFSVQIHLNHPETVKALLKSSEPKDWHYRVAERWLGQSVLTASGDRWRRSRRLITPVFHSDIAKPITDIVNNATETLLNKLEEHAAQHKSMEMFTNISLCTLDVILQWALGYKDDIQTKGETHPYVHAMATLTELTLERIKNPLVHSNWVYALTPNGRKYKKFSDYVHKVSEEIIANRRKLLEQEVEGRGQTHAGPLDLLLMARDETGQGLTAEQTRMEVDTILFAAGHDTTASGVAWTLYALVSQPDVQLKVQREVDTLLTGRQSDHILWADVSRLDYLHQVVKEALRLHTPVPSTSRVLTEALTVAGTTLPAGTTCTVNIYNVHRNPTVWDDPRSFRPERFLPENIKHRDPYSFIPFSAGPRNCIGQHLAMSELKVIISRLVRRFTFSLDPACKVQQKMSIVLRAENGMKMFATPRTPFC